MAKSDLQASPVYHHLRDSIEAHLTIAFATRAVSRWIQARTGWSIRKFVTPARRYHIVQIQAGQHTITAADSLPAYLRQPSTKSTAGRIPTGRRHPGRPGHNRIPVKFRTPP